MSIMFSIIGFGKSGVSAAKFLLKRFVGARVRVSELKAREAFASLASEISSLEASGVEFEFAKQSIGFICFQDQVLNAETKIFVMLSPGIPPSTALVQELKRIETSGQVLIGTDFDIFCDSLTAHQDYIAITGTNGKTTTTSLLAHIFANEAVGNIGKPFLEFDDSKFIACEISSFQLFHSKFPEGSAKPPKAAIHLNLTDDHLDWHSSLDEYKEAKAKLFQCSNTIENFLILNYDDLVCRKLAELKIKQINSSPDTKTKIALFSTKTRLTTLDKTQSLTAFLDNKTFYVNDLIAGLRPLFTVDELNLVGEHNYSNVLAAFLGAYSCSVDLDQIKSRIQSFVAVPHRLEYVCTIDGHRIFNDSKATNPDSAAKALESFDSSIIIVGGKDKHLDLNPFFDLLTKKAYAVIAIGELKESFYEGLKARNFARIFKAETLQDAFEKCLEQGKGNNLPIVLSPASSSFDMFSGYEERGNLFKNIANSHYVNI